MPLKYHWQVGLHSACFKWPSIRDCLKDLHCRSPEPSPNWLRRQFRRSIIAKDQSFRRCMQAVLRCAGGESWDMFGFSPPCNMSDNASLGGWWSNLSIVICNRIFLHFHTSRKRQGGRTWQAFGGGKNGHETFRQARIYNFRDKCVVFARNLKFSNLTQ